MPGPRPPSIILTPRQRAALESQARRATSPQRTVRRVQTILMAADGANNQQVATRLGIDRETAGIWRTRWLQASEKLTAADIQADDKTLRALIEDVLADAPRPGPPATFTPEQLCQLMALACESPQDSGRPVTRWTPRELADEVCRRGIVDAISPRTVGRFLKRGGFTAAFVPLLAQ